MNISFGCLLVEPYKILDHEADAGFEVYGRDEGELFQNSVHALFSLITDLELVYPAIEKHVEVPVGTESLIVFLNELLYLWDVENFIPKVVTIARGDKNITGTLKGETLDESRHTLLGTVKAVTYHQFSIQKDRGILKATFIVDM